MHRMEPNKPERLTDRFVLNTCVRSLSLSLCEQVRVFLQSLFFFFVFVFIFCDWIELSALIPQLHEALRVRAHAQFVVKMAPSGNVQLVNSLPLILNIKVSDQRSLCRNESCQLEDL